MVKQRSRVERDSNNSKNVCQSRPALFQSLVSSPCDDPKALFLFRLSSWCITIQSGVVVVVELNKTTTRNLLTEYIYKKQKTNKVLSLLLLLSFFVSDIKYFSFRWWWGNNKKKTKRERSWRLAALFYIPDILYSLFLFFSVDLSLKSPFKNK